MNYKIFLGFFLNTFFILMMLVKSVSAQKMFYFGYVVTNKGDTLKGKIPYDLGTNKNYHVVELKDDKGYVKKFNVWQIKMYCMNNQYYFTKKCDEGETEHRNGLVFMHLIDDGEIKLFEYEYVRNIGGARSYEEGGMSSGGEKDFYMENPKGDFLYLPFNSFKKVLKSQFPAEADCNDKLETEMKEYKNIPEIIKCYNSQ